MASYMIDMDVGGTFTDGFITRDGVSKSCKTPTTPHDLTVCCMECIEEGAKLWGISVKELLKGTIALRLSTTIGTNTIIQRSGPKIGLILTKGFENTLYNTQREVTHPLVPRQMIVGVNEAVDSLGRIVGSLDEEEVLSSMRHLVKSGARMVAVSYRNASANPTHEHETREVIYRRYPQHYLRSMRIQIATELNDMPGDYERTGTVILNAYLHPETARHLYKFEDMARSAGLKVPVFTVNSSGGVTRVAKTIAISTYNSGPAAGLVGASELCKLYGFKQAVTIDMGGTSTDIGLIAGDPKVILSPEIEGMRIWLPMLEIKCIGAGGGSIARVSEDGVLTVGPLSAGALPGPACYDMGGVEPTVTDASL